MLGKTGHGHLTERSKVRLQTHQKRVGTHTHTHNTQTWRSGCFEPNYSSEEGFTAIALQRRTEPGRPPPERRRRPSAGNPAPRPPALPSSRPRDQGQPQGGPLAPSGTGSHLHPAPPPTRALEVVPGLHGSGHRSFPPQQLRQRGQGAEEEGRPRPSPPGLGTLP